MAQSALRNLPLERMNARRERAGMEPFVPQAPTKTAGQAMADMLGGMSIPLSFVPVAGDVAGLAADAAMYATRPEERTLSNAAMTLAGIVPGIPSAAAIRAGGQAAEGALDMSQAARMQRAAEQGFDERVFYHGGASDFDEFVSGRRGNYFTNNPDIANIYAMNAEKRWPDQNNASPNVLPVRLRGPALVVSDQKNGSGGWYKENLQEALGIDFAQIPVSKKAQALREEAQRQGYGFLEITDMDDLGGRQSQFISLDPSNIRAATAAFDPAKRNSANLTAGIMGGAVGLSALRNIAAQQEQD